jgi:hypothetical protein
VSNTSALNYKDYEGLVAWCASKILRRAAAQGLHLEIKDVTQEVAMVWVRCAARFDPSRGVKFSTYFARAAAHEYGDIVAGLCPDRGRVVASLNDPVRTHDGGEMERIECTPDDNAEDPERQLLQSDHLAQALAVRPLLRRVAEICAAPDVEMRRELAALKSQSEWARQLGVKAHHQLPTGLTPRMVGKAVGFNWRDRRLLIESLEGAA